MLSMIGRGNSRLYDFLARDFLSRGSSTAGMIVQELERERSRIARELHAGAGQPLAGIKLNLEMLGDCYAALPQQGREALARLQTLTQQALEQVRAVSHSLHPPEWQSLTIGEALRNLVDASGLTTRLDVQLDVEPLLTEPPHSTRVAVYRCAQECISNITRHSGANRLTVSLRMRGSMLELLVVDNGTGFDSSVTATGLGLRALRDHARQLGGTCDLSSGPTGTTIVVRLPSTED